MISFRYIKWILCLVLFNCNWKGILRDFTFLFRLSFDKGMRSKRMSLSGLCLVLKLILIEERYSTTSSISISVVSVELFDVARVSTFISSSLFLIIFESFTYFSFISFPPSPSLPPSLPLL